ncbi:MAG: hypothetical protein TREMPRED_000659 [Tremellales sp. Tagirdzhanova-0007]|nr:MAG: hypothetical protein TREMPRED_000659 [Tremellales sp. Tagirdzhanova-0007]
MVNPAVPVIDAEVALECQNTLGEGLLWDSKQQLLHWVDIDTAEIHTFDPQTSKYSVDAYPETRYVTALALRKDELGFIGTIAHDIVLFPAPTTPTSTMTPSTPKPRKTLKTLSSPLPSDEMMANITRMNDGGCDPAGRFFAGSMTLPELKDGKKRGELWRVDPDGKETKILAEVGTSNGIGWSPDGRAMYYIDSVFDEISVFDYDNSTGTPTNRRVFANSPPPIDEEHPTQGIFDGLTVDGVGNVWSARWKDSRVIGFRPDGSIICHIRLRDCKSPTIPCFGGKDLNTMYIATAHSKLAREGDIQDTFPHSGDLYKLDFGEGSEVRKLLAADWKGRERNRFSA